jgi:lipoprotein NlpI
MAWRTVSAEALAICKDINDRLGEANVYDSLALASIAKQDFQAALAFHEQARQVFEMTASPYKEGWS